MDDRTRTVTRDRSCCGMCEAVLVVGLTAVLRFAPVAGVLYLGLRSVMLLALPDPAAAASAHGFYSPASE